MADQRHQDTADTATAGMGTVHVAVKFGDQTSDETLFLEQKDGKWKLKQAAIKLDTGQTRSYDEAAMKTLTLFGKPIGDDSVVYVFPGWVDLGNSNKNLTMKRNNDTPFLLNGISVKTVEGGTKTGIATVYLSGTADLTSSPPKISI